jgi:hypothetical protein
MTVRARFRLDDEATDTPHITEQLAALKREVPGLELGADVTLYYCAVCDYAQAEFAAKLGEAEEQIARLTATGGQ